MKLKKINIQVLLGFIFIIFSLFSTIFGSYNLYLSDLTNFIDKTATTYSNLNMENYSKGEKKIIMTNIPTYINIQVLTIKTNFYNFILENILIFLFGLNFVFQGLKNNHK